MNKIYIELEGYDSIEKIARAYGRSGGVAVPKIWIGGQVRAVLINNDHVKKGDQGKQKKRITIPLKKYLYQLYTSDIVKKTVRKQGGSGHVHLPQKWAGKHVKVILFEKPEEKED